MMPRRTPRPYHNVQHAVISLLSHFHDRTSSRVVAPGSWRCYQHDFHNDTKRGSSRFLGELWSTIVQRIIGVCDI